MRTVQIHETDSRYLKLPSILKFLYRPLPQVLNLLKNANFHKIWVSTKWRSIYSVNVNSVLLSPKCKTKREFCKNFHLLEKFWMRNIWISAKNWQILETKTETFWDETGKIQTGGLERWRSLANYSII